MGQAENQIGMASPALTEALTEPFPIPVPQSPWVKQGHPPLAFVMGFAKLLWHFSPAALHPWCLLTGQVSARAHERARARVALPFSGMEGHYEPVSCP